MERAKAKHTIDISMRLLIDDEEHVYVDSWQVNNLGPHGKGAVKATTPEPRKGRQFKLHEIHGHYEVCDRETCYVDGIFVREILPGDKP